MSAKSEIFDISDQELMERRDSSGQIWEQMFANAGANPNIQELSLQYFEYLRNLQQEPSSDAPNISLKGELAKRLSTTEVNAAEKLVHIGEDIEMGEAGSLFQLFINSKYTAILAYMIDIATNYVGAAEIMRMSTGKEVSEDWVSVIGLIFLSSLLAISRELADSCSAHAMVLEREVAAVKATLHTNHTISFTEEQILRKEHEVKIFRGLAYFFYGCWAVDLATSAVPFIDRYGVVVGGTGGAMFSAFIEFVESRSQVKVLRAMREAAKNIIRS